METHLAVKLKRWVNAIALEDLSSITLELEEFLKSSTAQKSVDKVLFKLLQHLSHATSKYNGDEKKLGSELAKLTSLICSNLTTVPHTRKFFSSIYHILAYTMDMGFYLVSNDVCDIFVQKLDICASDESITKREIMESMSNLWHKVGSKMLKDSSTGDCKSFARILEHELYLIRLMGDDSSYYCVLSISSYSKRIVLEVDPSHKEKLIDIILKYAKKFELEFNDKKSDSTWQLICELIAMLIGKDINADNVEQISKNYKRCFEAFQSSVTKCKKYWIVLSLWDRLCGILLRPITEFTYDSVIHMNNWLKKFDDSLRKIDKNIIKPYCYAVLHLFTSSLNYWEVYSKKNETESIHVDVIVALLNLSRKHSDLYGTFDAMESTCQSHDCKIKTDTYNELVIKIKCLLLISRRQKWLVTESIRKIGIDLIDTCMKLLKALKSGSCERWTVLWPPWGAAIYNMGVNCETIYPSASIEYYTSLYKSIVALEGVKNCRRLWSFDDPLGTVLHRLTSICLKSEDYTRARRIASVNCLLSHDVVDSKAYRDWLNIKLKDSEQKEVNVIQYLRSNESEIPQVSLDDYDLVKVCLREMKTLQDSTSDMSRAMFSILDEMEHLEATPSDYAEAVQLAAYHLLNFHTELSMIKYTRKASLMYEREKSPSFHFRCAYAILKFYEFVEKTQRIARKTETDMKNAILILSGKSRCSGCETERNEYDIIPAYSAINMSVTSDLESCLKQTFTRWREILDIGCRNYAKDWQIRHTLNTIIIAGEYCRLYHFEGLEKQAWIMTYRLAHEISDSVSLLYATSRSLTSHFFDPNWIPRAEKHALRLEESNDRDAPKILRRYRLGLANYYYKNNEIDKADEIFISVSKELDFMQDFSNFLLMKEIEMKYRLGRDESNEDQLGYTNIIVQCLYTLLSIDDSVENSVYSPKEKQLYDYELLFRITNSLSIPMNALLSYREISAHLVKRLGSAQKLVTSLRVAECLKYLCYIDLSRVKLENCEVKLQGLEHILEIEAIDATMRSKLSPSFNYQQAARNCTSPTRDASIYHSTGQSDASPVLRKKVFSKPDFMLHGQSCSCFKCTNSSYQYLVFAATHIRAQLFALQGDENSAFQHFYGAMKIRKYILLKEHASDAAGRESRTLCLCPKHQCDAIEYVMFRLDYCRFLAWFVPTLHDDVMAIALDALESCEKYNLRNHPVYMAVNEFIFQCRFEKSFANSTFSKFMVPDIDKIDVSRYENTSSEVPLVCVTPIREVMEKNPISVKRRNNPPLLTLDRVPVVSTNETPTKPNFPAPTRRRVRRKICVDEDESKTSEESSEVSVPLIKVSSPEKITENSLKRKPRRKCTEEESSDVGEVTDMLAGAQIGSKRKTTRSTRKTQPMKIPEVAESLNDVLVDKKSEFHSHGSVTSDKEDNPLGENYSCDESKTSENLEEVSAPLVNISLPDKNTDNSTKRKTRKKNCEKESVVVEEMTEMLARAQIGSKRSTRSSSRAKSTKIHEVAESVDNRSETLSCDSDASEKICETLKNEDNSLGARNSSRLRARSSAQSQNSNDANNSEILALDSDDEFVVAKTRSARQLFKPKEQSTNKKNCGKKC